MELLIFINHYGSLLICISILESILLFIISIKTILDIFYLKKLEKLFHEVDHNFSEGNNENE